MIRFPDQPTHFVSTRMRALEIMMNGSVRPLSASIHEVRQENGHVHRVAWQGHKWRCSCQRRRKYPIVCEHIYAVLLSKSYNPSLRVSQTVCPDCKADRARLIRRGIRKNKYGLVQRYSCRRCGLRFDDRQGFRGMKGSPEVITATLDLWYKGLSLNKIADHLDQFYGLRIEISTLYGWIKKYTSAMKRYTRSLRLTTAAKWHADETMIGVKGKSRYLWAAMGGRTRFIIATSLTVRRRSKDARTLLQRGLKRILKGPKRIVTDGLSSYKIPISTLDTGSGPAVHVRGLSFARQGNNNRIERLNGTIKERTKVMRGFHNHRSAALFVDGFADYYNFIRPHQALAGRTPAEKARLLKLRGNRWIGLARQASVNSHHTLAKKPHTRVRKPPRESHQGNRQGAREKQIRLREPA